LIERIAPKGKAVSEAISLAKRILQRGPVAVMNSKKAINASITMTFEEGLKRETELFSALFETQDTKEGVSAFLEKRKPNFIGR
jgi:enoyl-CoA hydratase